MRSSSMVTPGSGMTSEPVAISTFLVASSLTAPLRFSCATTLPGLSIRPAPST